MVDSTLLGFDNVPGNNNDKMKDELFNFLGDGRDWDELPTDNKAVKVQKVPPSKSRSAKLMIVINPLGNDSKPIKRRGIAIDCEEHRKLFAESLGNPSVANLLKLIEEINGKNNKKSSAKVLSLG